MRYTTAVSNPFISAGHLAEAHVNVGGTEFAAAGGIPVGDYPASKVSKVFGDYGYLRRKWVLRDVATQEIYALEWSAQ